MRIKSSLLVLAILALLPGTAPADPDAGISGSDWDDSHMRTRYQPAQAKPARVAAEPSTLPAVSSAPNEARILPASEYREWQTGPNPPAVAARSASKKPLLDSATSHGMKADAGRSSSRGASRRASSRARKTSR